jgi:branched-chain amino acid transport system substrate-binding protein
VKKPFFIMLLLVLLVGLLVIASAQAKPKAPTGEPYVIGAIFSITGDASSLGIPERNTAQMLEKQINAAGGINGHPLKVIIEDDRGEPAETLNVAKRLVERDNVLAIVGPSRTGNTLAIKSYMESVRTPLVSCAAGVDIVEPVNPWVFKTPQSDKMAAEKFVPYLKSKKIQRVAILSDNTAFGKGGLKELQKYLPAAGVDIVDTEEYGPKDSSMETQLTKIKGTKAQALICWGTPPGPAIVAKNMKQLAIKIPLLCSHGVANDTFLKLAGDAANGVIITVGPLLVANEIPGNNPQKKVLLEYAKMYQKEFGKSADTFGGHAWDSINLVAKALAETGPSRTKLRARLERIKGYVGVGGVFNFSRTDHNGLTKDAFVIAKVVDGKWKLVSQ